MVTTQVSFSAFALAQQAASCTPPAAIPDAAPVVAHGLGVGSGGECTPRPCDSALRYERWQRLRAHPAFLARRYAVYWPGSDDALCLIRWSSRAWAFNTAKRHGCVFVDLGAAA